MSHLSKSSGSVNSVPTSSVQFQANVISSLGSMHPQGQQPGGMQHTMGGQPGQAQQLMQGQPMTQMGQPMQPGQYQIVQQPYGAANGGGQFTLQPFATYNQQGQLVLQQGSFALPAGMQMAQQGGQQQIILTNMPQKPGQPPQMIASPMGQTSTSKALTGVSQGYTLTTGGLVSASGGTTGPQTYMIAANGQMALTGHQSSAHTSVSSVSSQMKPGDHKSIPGTAQLPQHPSGPHPQSGGQNTQPMVLPQGMTYVNPQQNQAIFQNGQLIFRSPAAQDGSSGGQALMFSPSGQPMGQSMSGNPHQLTTSMAQSMSLAMPMGSSPMRPPVSLPQQPPPGKTPISRNLAPLLPTGSPASSRPGLSPMTTYSTVQSSPKGKTKMSPKGPIGRPPGPAKSALNAVKGPTSTMSPPPRLPCSPVPNASSRQAGPPILQTSQGLPVTPTPNASSSFYSQPPKLQPMLPTPVLIPSLDTNKTTSSGLGVASSVKDESKVTKTDKPVPAEEKPAENLPKAVVKPNILSHHIDGHHILESSEPFPVDKADKGVAVRKTKKSDKTSVGVSVNGTTTATTISTSLSGTTPTITSSHNGLTSSHNGKKSDGTPATEKKRGPGRPPGSTRQSIEQQRLNADKAKNHGDGPPPSKKSKGMEQSAMSADPSDLKAKNKIDVEALLKGTNPLKWSVQQVCDFVKELPGCSDYVEDFLLQEIDGQALMLLKADHLMSAMAIKLGPALKICSAIDAMREELKQN